MKLSDCIPGDNNACTMDECNVELNGAGCTHRPLVCNDNNSCTIDSCDTVKGIPSSSSFFFHFYIPMQVVSLIP